MHILNLTYLSALHHYFFKTLEKGNKKKKLRAEAFFLGKEWRSNQKILLRINTKINYYLRVYGMEQKTTLKMQRFICVYRTGIVKTYSTIAVEVVTTPTPLQILTASVVKRTASMQSSQTWELGEPRTL